MSVLATNAASAGGLSMILTTWTGITDFVELCGRGRGQNSSLLVLMKAIFLQSTFEVAFSHTTSWIGERFQMSHQWWERMLMPAATWPWHKSALFTAAV